MIVKNLLKVLSDNNTLLKQHLNETRKEIREKESYLKRVERDDLKAAGATVTQRTISNELHPKHLCSYTHAKLS